MRCKEGLHPHFGKSLFLDNGTVELIIPLEYGIRIGHFSFIGEKNVFYEQPHDMKALTTEDGWRLRGGHRLWLTPENDSTYYPDNDKINYELQQDSVILTQPLDKRLGVEKSICVSFGEGACVHLTHKIVNRNENSISRALWPVTVVAPGGIEYIPLGKNREEIGSFSQISWWFHTSLADERASYGKEQIVIRHLPIDKPYKIGLAHPFGPVRYERNGVAFEKTYLIDRNAVYPDGGVSYETFFCMHMAEIESLSPVYTLAPSDSAEHKETWKLYRV